jgi:hypothetical protein
MGAILGLLRGLATFASELMGFLREKHDQDVGAAIEAGRVSEVAARTEAAIAKAEVEAPTTKAGVIDDLKKGEF